MDDKLISRAKIIYERDNSSPLFLRIADSHLRNNNPLEAIPILESGLKIFPNHPLAFILLSKAHYALKNIQATKSCLKKASELLNSSQLFTHYKKEYNLPDKQISPFDSSRGNIFINSTDDYILNEETNEDQSKSVEDNLQQIAEKLMNTRLDKDNNISIDESNHKKYNPDKSRLASETLANIYLSQNQKDEAIRVYELLASRIPEKKEYFLEKIKEIKSQ